MSKYRKNCWEVMKCGREPGGEHVHDLGVCPAAMPGEHDEVNRGSRRGRCCWVVAGTLCGGTRQGTYACKLESCLECKFLRLVLEEEGREFVLNPQTFKK